MNGYDTDRGNDGLPPFAGSASASSDAAKANINDVPANKGHGDSIDTLRSTVINLINRGKIKKTQASVKKLGRKTLERILAEHAQRKIDETNELLSDALLNQIGDLMGDVSMVKELNDNELFKRDAKTLIGYITPYIPMIGLVCGGLIVAMHACTKTKSQQHAEEEDKQEQ